MKDEGKELLERQRIAEEKSKVEKKTFGVKISFLGEYLVEVKAVNYEDAASMLEGTTDDETQENLEEAIRLEIGTAQINDMLEIDVLEIVSIEVE